MGCDGGSTNLNAQPDAAAHEAGPAPEAGSPVDAAPMDDRGFASDSADVTTTVDAADAGEPPEASDAKVCDPTEAPQDDPCVLSGAYGLFVSPQGVDTNPGTPTAPLKSVALAVERASTAGQARVYLCNGVYSEAVHLLSGVSLYGGFDCSGDAGIRYVDGTFATISPPSNHIALIVDGVDAAVAVEDIGFRAADGVGDDDAGNGQSSVAVLVNASTATFRRCILTAGNGDQGADGQTPSNYMGTSAPDGTVNNGGLGGAGGSITCANGSVSFGGGGGGLTSGAIGGDGGATPMASAMPDLDGIGGACEGDTGASGSGSTLGGVAPIEPGVLTPLGWISSAGGVGGAGGPGQGGGGGGQSGTFGGMGGGAGGCGGAGGTGGGGGGASIALAILNGHVDIDGCMLVTSIGGNGGRGGDGQSGQGGGVSPQGASGVCPGGTGGNGGGGAGGAGGTGGIAACTIWSGTGPVGTALCSLGDQGRPGLGGAGGLGGMSALGTASAGSSAAAGQPGIAQAQFGLP